MLQWYADYMDALESGDNVVHGWRPTGHLIQENFGRNRALFTRHSIPPYKPGTCLQHGKSARVNVQL